MVALPELVLDGAADGEASAEPVDSAEADAAESDAAEEEDAEEDAAGEDTAAEPLGTVIGTPAALQRPPVTARDPSLNTDVSTTHAQEPGRRSSKKVLCWSAVLQTASMQDLEALM